MTRALVMRRPDYAPLPEQSPLADFIRRWWLLLLVGTLVGAGAGFAFGKLGPNSYQSTALIEARANPNSSRPDTDAQIAALGFASEVTAPSLLDHVSQALKADGIDIGTPELFTMSQSNKLVSQPVKGSSAITIQASYDNPTTAQAIADKVAQVAVDDTASQAQSESDAQTTAVQQEMDRARNELRSAALFQREQDLQQRLQAQQAEFVQLQTGFTQTLQQQLQISLAMRQQSTPPPQPPRPSADQQRQLDATSKTASDALTSQMAMLKDQQNAATQTLTNVDAQLSTVRNQLAALPDPTGGTDASNPQLTPNVDVTAAAANLQQQQAQLRNQVGQEQDLEKQEHDLQTQSTTLHQQITSLGTQIQQMQLNQQTQDQQRQQQQASLQQQIQAEVNHQGLLKASLDTIVPLKGQTDLNNQQQVQLQTTNTEISSSRDKVNNLTAQLQELSQGVGTSASTTNASVQLLQQQLQASQQSASGVDAQLGDIHNQRVALQQTLGANPAFTIQTLGDRIQQLQQQQHDQDQATQQTQSQWLALKQQETDLLRQRQDAQNQQLQNERDLQADIQRQADLSTRDIQTQVAQSGQQTASASSDAPLPQDLVANASDQRDALLKQIKDQQQQLTTSIADLNKQLDEVHQAQAALPTQIDPTQASMLVTVNTQLLDQLSQEYTKLLIGRASGVGPLERFGQASPAVTTGGQTRLLALGAAAGLFLAGLLGLLAQVVVHPRAAVAEPPTGAPPLPSGNRLSRGRRGGFALGELARRSADVVSRGGHNPAGV